MAFAKRASCSSTGRPAGRRLHYRFRRTRLNRTPGPKERAGGADLRSGCHTLVRNMDCGRAGCKTTIRVERTFARGPSHRWPALGQSAPTSVGATPAYTRGMIGRERVGSEWTVRFAYMYERPGSGVSRHFREWDGRGITVDAPLFRLYAAGRPLAAWPGFDKAPDFEGRLARNGPGSLFPFRLACGG